MLLQCTLFAVLIIYVTGDALSEEDLANFQLLVPIRYFNQEVEETLDFPEALGRPGSLSDEPFSRIPASEFELDDANFVDYSPKKTVKKDLSHTAFTIVSDPSDDLSESLSTDVAESCLIHMFQGIVHNEQQTRLDHDLLDTLCKHFLSSALDKQLSKPSDSRIRNSFKGYLDSSGVAGRPSVDSRVRGRGFRGGYVVQNTMADGFVESVLKKLGIGNGRVKGRSSYAGNLALDGLGNKVGNLGVNRVSEVRGNAFSGQGITVGNIALYQKGSQRGDLAVGGNGDLFGSLGIDVQGFYGDISTESKENQDLDIEKELNPLSFLFGQLASQKQMAGANVQQTPVKYVTSTQILKPRSLIEVANLVLSGSPATYSTLEQVSPDPPTKPVEVFSVNVFPGKQELAAVSSPDGEDTSDDDDLAGLVLAANVKSVDFKAVKVQDNETLSKGQAVLGQSGDVQVEVTPVARIDGGESSGGQVGGVVCGGCVHVLLMRKTPQVDVSVETRTHSEKTQSPLAQSEQEHRVAAKPHSSMEKFRPIGGRRTWSMINGQHDWKLRQYMNSRRKPWTYL